MPQSGNGAVMNAIASGSKAYGVLVDYMAIREKAKGAPIEFTFPKEGVSIVTEPVAMLKNAKNPQAAKAFIDFLLSTEGRSWCCSRATCRPMPLCRCRRAFRRATALS